MKKLLIATTALVAGASAAAADVTISGYGRFGLQYFEDRGITEGLTGAAADAVENTQIASRLRITINASTETDVGVTFGARLRFQNDGEAGTAGNKAMFSVGYEGFNVQVGNVDTALDSVGLTYDSEMGFDDTSFGDQQGSFWAYRSQGAHSRQQDDYTGVAATYSVSDINLYFSYIDPSQGTKGAYSTREEEVGFAGDWTNGQISIAAGITQDGSGIKDNDLGFIGAAYNFGDGVVGLNYYDNGKTSAGLDNGTQVTLYGNYTFGATTLKAYVSDWDHDTVDYKTAYGIGADYSLGEGARISGSVQRGFGIDQGNYGTTADLGVRFDF
ncbi:porin [Xinfangfangia sp. D13-10-4-6]|uniref:porin n=1 Tax=Pseudogemmobacter hezensis TaxID=2737662 RepID=UPI0015564844|nr:porin [Pseudogemmobacter hezensis]NPD14259.1 porin [Pseudogemmobacter hezensis]